MATGNVTINVPSGVANDDDLWLIVIHDASLTGVGSVTITNPAGWTLIDQQSMTWTPACVSNGGLGKIFRRIASSEPSSYTVTVAHGTNGDLGTSAMMLAYIGADTTTPEDVTGSSTTGVVVSPQSPAITTVTDHAWVLSIAGNVEGALTAAPSGMTMDDNYTVINGGLFIGTAHFDKSPTGVYTPSTWGSQASTWMAFTVAIRPGNVVPAPSQDWQNWSDSPQPIPGPSVDALPWTRL